jgi:hypothetical protein
VIETVYTLTKAEFFEGQRLWCPRAVRKLPGHWLIQGVYVAFSLLILFSVRYLPFWLAIAFALCMASYAVLIVWRKDRVQAIQFDELKDSVREISLRIDSEGYHDQKESMGSCSIAWKRFTGWREGDNVFILGINLQFITIPKTALSEDQQNELRTLLQALINPR